MSDDMLARERTIENLQRELDHTITSCQKAEARVKELEAAAHELMAERQILVAERNEAQARVKLLEAEPQIAAEMQSVAQRHGVSVHLSWSITGPEEHHNSWCLETTSPSEQYDFCIRSSVSVRDALVKLAICLQHTAAADADKESDTHAKG